MAHKANAQPIEVLRAHTALLTRPLVLQVLGTGLTRFKRGVKEGWLPPPVHLGRSARWLASDVREVITAIGQGKASVPELQALVERLIAQRQKAMRG